MTTWHGEGLTVLFHRNSVQAEHFFLRKVYTFRIWRSPQQRRQTWHNKLRRTAPKFTEPTGKQKLAVVKLNIPGKRIPLRGGVTGWLHISRVKSH